jgi:hypothetical protein
MLNQAKKGLCVAVLLSSAFVAGSAVSGPVRFSSEAKADPLLAFPIQIKHSGLCLDGRVGLGDVLSQEVCDGSESQQFFRPRIGDAIQLRTADADRCVELESTAQLAFATMQTCDTGDPLQRFALIAVGDGFDGLRNEASGFCLDVPGASQDPGQGLIQFACGAAPSPNRSFLVGLSGKVFYVRSADDNKAWHLDGLGDQLVSMRVQPDNDTVRFVFHDRDANGDYLIGNAAVSENLGVDNSTQLLSSVPSLEASARRFAVVAEAGGAFVIRVRSSGKVLHYDPSADSLISTRFQPDDIFVRFVLEATQVRREELASPVIAKHSNLCIGVPSSAQAGTLLVQRVCDGSDGQQIIVRAVDATWNQLVVGDTGHCIEANPNILQPMFTAECRLSSRESQLFSQIDTADGFRALSNQASGLCLDVPGASTAPGNPVGQFACGNPPSDNRRFKILRLYFSGFEARPIPH